MNNLNADPLNLEKDIKFLKNKVKIYNDQLSKKFNKIHNLKLSKSFWNIVLNYHLLNLCTVILREYKYLKKKPNINYTKKKIYLPQSRTLEESHMLFDHHSGELNQFIKYVIAKKMKIKTSKIKIILTKKNFLKIKKISLKNYFLTKIIRIYCHLFKPILILNPFFGKRKTLNIFFKTKGRLLLIPADLFLEKNHMNCDLKKNYFRNKISIKEKDMFDKIFNEILKFTIPCSLTQNFYHYYNKNKDLSKKIKIIGSCGLLSSNDNYKFFSGLIKNHGGKLVALQFGGEINKLKYQISELDEKTCCDKTFSWNEKEGFATNQLHRLENHRNIIRNQVKPIKENILIFPYPKNFNLPAKNLNENYKRDLFKSYDYIFYKYLNYENKKKTIIKILHNQPETKFHINIWKKKFGVKTKVTDKKNSLYYFQKSKIAIVDFIYCTAVYELAFLNIPFIIIDNEHYEFKKKFQKIFKKLEKLKIIFNDPKKAAIFLNKNYNNVDAWWKKIIKTKEYKNFKKTLFNENKDDLGQLFFERLQKI
jgi:putative transferase (TIGR04331 family)